MRAIGLLVIAAAAFCTVSGVIIGFGDVSGKPVSPRDVNWPVAVAEGGQWGVEASARDLPDAAAPVPTMTGPDGTRYAAGQVLVSFDGAITEDMLRVSLAEAGIEAVDVRLVSNMLEGDDVLVQVSYADDLDPQALAESLSACRFVKSAEPNYIFRMLETEDGPVGVAIDGTGPFAEHDAGDSDGGDVQLEAQSNDPHYSSQWGLEAVGASAAWDMRQANGSVTVAVIDSGVDYDHPDLASNLIVGSYAKNTYTESAGASAVNDVAGHGTHVAGVIAAVADNSLGVAGISYNAKVLPVKVTYNTAGDMYNADVIEALDYIVALKTAVSSPDALKNIRVINMSLGGYSRSSQFDLAVERATAAGMLVVAAAGNDSTSKKCYPAAYASAMGVSALCQSDTGGMRFDSSYSNHGSYVDISAPGTNIYSTTLAGGYKNMSGTSMAAPLVSGAAALVFSAKMLASPSEVELILEDTAQDAGQSGWDQYYGYGMMRVDQAVRSVVVQSISTAVVADIPRQVYTGAPLKPNVVVTYDDSVLEEDVDYTLSYQDNVYYGTATVTVHGVGRFTGTCTKTFEIVTQPLAKPQEYTSLVYNGLEQRGFPGDDWYLVDGDEAAVNAGDYVCTITLKDHAYWSDGTRDAVVVRWRIEPLKVAVPEQRDVVYNGVEQEGFAPNEHYVLSGQTSGTEAGSYYAFAQLNNANYVWQDDAAGQRQIAWSIAPKPLYLSDIVVDGLIYTGELQQGVKPGEGYEAEGQVTAVAVGDYTATLRLGDGNHIWSDGTTGAKSVTWHVAGRQCDMSGVSFDDAVFVYDGLPHSVEISGKPPFGVRVHYEGNRQTAFGEHLVTAVFDGSSEGYDPIPDMTARLVIVPVMVDLPRAERGLSYTGNPQTGFAVPTHGGYTLAGTLSATDAGVYEAVASLNDKAGSVWSAYPYNSADVALKWIIAQASVFDVEVADIPTQYYRGFPVTPDPVVAFNGRVLVKGVDYDLAYRDNGAIGRAALVISGKGNFSNVREVPFEIVAEPDPRDAGVTMHRLYNRWSSEHLYTGDDAERRMLEEIGWFYEGEEWIAPQSSDTPVYRLYNPYTGEHHFTASNSEKDSCVMAGWAYEDICWYSANGDDVVPVYRLYNPYADSFCHHYTTSVSECAAMTRKGWHPEGVGWHGLG